MITQMLDKQKVIRPAALLLTAAMTLPPFLAGCGSNQQVATAPQPGANMPRMSQPMRQPAMNTGMSTKKKVVLLAGAAALYYIYNKRKNAQAAQGPQGKYFKSEANGRIYYRDMKTGAFQWVSPPSQPIQVPAEEAQEYSGYAGYNGNSQGQSYGGYGPGARNYRDAEPAQPLGF